MEQYRKLIVATVGFLIIFLKSHFNIEVPDATVNAIVDAIIQIGTLFLIYKVNNDPPKL